MVDLHPAAFPKHVDEYFLPFGFVVFPLIPSNLGQDLNAKVSHLDDTNILVEFDPPVKETKVIASMTFGINSQGIPVVLLKSILVNK
jgi:hypothetical protein